MFFIIVKTSRIAMIAAKITNPPVPVNVQDSYVVTSPVHELVAMVFTDSVQRDSRPLTALTTCVVQLPMFPVISGVETIFVVCIFLINFLSPKHLMPDINPTCDAKEADEYPPGFLEKVPFALCFDCVDFGGIDEHSYFFFNLGAISFPSSRTST